jgi:thiol-disulfide isomerase/thioredoxin
VYRGIDFQGMSVQDIRAEMFPAIFSFIAVLHLAAMVMYMRSVSRKQSEILRRIELLELISRDSSEVRRDEAGDPHLGRPIGAWFPRFNLPDSSGRPVTLDDLRQNSRPLLFIFVAPGCEPCAALVPEIGEWKQQFAGRVDIVLFSSGDVEQNRAKFGKTSDMLLIDDGREIATAAGARWTPTAVFVDANGKIASQIAAGDQAIRELVEKIAAARLDGPLTYFTRRDHHGRGLKIGETVPEFTLEDLEGRSVNDADLKGRSTLVAFWSTRCPHCERMLPELKEWERSRRNGDPGLIVFSDGDVEEHRALELRSPVVLDKGYKVAEKLGMFGTPSAVLIDESGTIISETAVGAENIWSLLAPKQ